MCRLFFIFTLLFGIAAEAAFDDLFKCNLRNENVSFICNVEHETHLYRQALLDESNYTPISQLEGWLDKEYPYPHVHPGHRILLDTLKELGVSSVCELGAGAGKVCKYLYFENPGLNITCVEHNAVHLKQMEENFQSRTHVISPNISVPAQRIKGALPELPNISSNAFDAVFTCTVMMHIPFIPAVLSAMEMVRISKKYILHVENKNQGGDWYSMTVVKPSLMGSCNYQGIDYVKLYEKLGVKTLKYYEYKDPSSPATFIFYLGEK